MEIAGLPLHPLVVHAAVVFTPLAALGAIVFAVVPRWRYLTRWPTAVLTVLAFVSVWVSRISGHSFLKDRPELAPAVRVHESRGDQLSLLVIVFLVVVAVGVWALGDASRTADGGARESRVAVLEKVLPVLVVVAALVVLVWVVLTGDAGARAVWG